MSFAVLLVLSTHLNEPTFDGNVRTDIFENALYEVSLPTVLYALTLNFVTVEAGSFETVQPVLV